MAGFINANFVAVEAHIKEHPAWFHRFDVSWTPTVLILDPNGIERFRMEGYLPKDEFQAQLEMGLGRVAFKRKKFADAGRIYRSVAEKHRNAAAVPEAEYWAAVSDYKASNDHTVLEKVAETLSRNYPGNLWTMKASPWL